MQQISPELSTAQPANTCKTEYNAIFCVKCCQVILESLVVQSMGANEIHDFNNSLHRFLHAAASFCTQSLLMNNAMIRKQVQLSDSLTDIVTSNQAYLRHHPCKLKQGCSMSTRSLDRIAVIAVIANVHSCRCAFQWTKAQDVF